jgi:hypothetical protein
MLRRYLPAIVCVVSVLAILVEALSGGGPSRKLGLDPVADAATNSLDAKTVQVEMVMRQGNERMVMIGVMDNERNLGEFNGSLQGIDLHEFMSGTTVYVDVPPMAQVMNGRHWMKLDMKELFKKLGVKDVGKLLDSSSDPSAPLEQLAKASLDAQPVGPTRIRGERATKYHIDFALSQFISTLPPDQANAMRRLQEKAAIGDRVLEDVWVDTHSRIRRLAMGYDMLGNHVSMRLDFVRYGVPVNIQLPPDGETIDALDALKKAGISPEDLAKAL